MGNHARTVMNAYPFDALRPMKFMGAAHFTLRCGRQLSSGSTGAPAYQLPLVALVCNFGSAALASDSFRPINSLGLSFIASGRYSISAVSAFCVDTHRLNRNSWIWYIWQGMPQLETLYHELGHALNSVLSRTEFQHVSGEKLHRDHGSAAFMFGKVFFDAYSSMWPFGPAQRTRCGLIRICCSGRTVRHMGNSFKHRGSLQHMTRVAGSCQLLVLGCCRHARRGGRVRAAEPADGVLGARPSDAAAAGAPPPHGGADAGGAGARRGGGADHVQGAGHPAAGAFMS